MALHHAAPGEVVDLAHPRWNAPEGQSIALFRTPEVEVIRRVLHRGQSVPRHQVEGPVLFHCLSGTVRIALSAGAPVLAANQMTWAGPGEAYGFEAHEDSVLLMTIVRRPD